MRLQDFCYSQAESDTRRVVSKGQQHRTVNKKAASDTAQDVWNWGYHLTRQEQQVVLRLWKDWCRVWPEQYGHDSLQVSPEGYDPVFDLIPSQAYKDFYFEVVRGHPKLRHLNAFEIIDAALNQVRAPEMPVVSARIQAQEQEATVVEIDIPLPDEPEKNQPPEADIA